MRRGTTNRLTVAVALAVIAACAPRPTLTPAPEAQPAPGPPGGATAVAAGVEVRAWPEQWDADPANLVAEVTPLLVRLENRGTQDVLIRYELFELRNPAGDNFSAIPPFELDATVVEPIMVPRYPVTGFRVAPHLRAYYPRLSPFADPFALDRAFWTRHHTAWRDIQLPTADMVQMALPEGVLEPGGVVSGFVYFERLTEQPTEVTLDYRLTTPAGNDVGSVRIPFSVETVEF
jgi:hypothetical protein